jgi:hypothetical protein
VTAWDAQLDRFEAGLADQRRAVAEGWPEAVVAFVPQQLGPLPAALLERARALLEQADALTSELTAATAAAARQLQVVTVMNGSQQPASSYIDQRG